MTRRRLLASNGTGSLAVSLAAPQPCFFPARPGAAREPGLTLDKLERIRGLLLAEFGGAGGIRDEGMLDSALRGTPNLWHYGSRDVHALAAAYAFGLVRNRPFVDGNKRMGFATCVLFLELNGLEFTATEVDPTIQTLVLAAHELDERGYAGWLKRMSKLIKTRLIV